MPRWIIKKSEERKRKSTVNDRKCYVCTYSMMLLPSPNPPQAHAHPDEQILSIKIYEIIKRNKTKTKTKTKSNTQLTLN